MNKLAKVFLVGACLLPTFSEAQSSRPKIPISIQCSCPDRLGKIFGVKLKAVIADSTPYRLADKSQAVFRYLIVSTDGDKTKLAPTGHLSAISVLITGDRDQWVRHAVYAVTDDTVNEAMQSDLRGLSDLIMEAMRQKGN